MQRVNNFGSVMQAYSLKHIIESLGHEVDFIDIIPNTDPDITEITNTYNSYTECEEHFTKRGLRAIDRYFFIRAYNKISFHELEGAFKEFQEKYLFLDSANNDKQYDVCVIGSDEVFNCLQNTKWGFSRQLYGDVQNANKIITYAACAGNTTVESLPSIAKNAISDSFKRISAFSVRDSNTQELVQSLAGKKPLLHLDPVAIGDFEEETKEITIPNLPDKYCIIYAYRNRIKESQEIQNILNFCKSKGLTPISIGGTQKWLLNHYVLSPFQAIYAFKHAEYILTDTFHGAVFSAKYANRFSVIVRNSNSNKLSDFSNRTGIMNHVIHGTSELMENYEVLADRPSIDAFLAQERNRALEYLNENISNCHHV